MNKAEWKNFKFNCFEKVWFWSRAPWVINLLNFPFAAFLSKFTKGKKYFISLLKLRFLFKRKVVFGLLEYMVTTKCTLNCRHCNTQIPYFKNGAHTSITKFEDFKTDIDKVLAACDYVNILGFVGGEPMLCADLSKMIEYALSKKKIKGVFLATNSTILPNEELLKVMKNKKFAVLTSDYSHVKNIENGVTVKYDEHKEILSKAGVKFNNHHEKLGSNNWISMPKVYKDKQDAVFIQKQWRNCIQICNIIIEGKLIPCTMSAFIWQNLDLTDGIKKEVVDVRNSKSSKELSNKLIEYFSVPNSEFCHYCHFENIQTGLPCGEQISAEEAALYIQNNKNL